jgi:RimJ/RimL family protein N-acetyltransferase
LSLPQKIKHGTGDIARKKTRMPEHETTRIAVRIVPWGADDLSLLKELLGDPAMTEYLGGPESAEKLAERQSRYEQLADSGKGRMFKIVNAATGEALGSVGYWEHDQRGEQVYETGWSVLPEFQGHGVASAGTAQAIAQAQADGRHRYLYAFPSVENAPSNAVCRKLGFTLVEQSEYEYPPGHPIRCNDWRLGLFAHG